MTETSFALRFENQDLIEKLRNEITIREQVEEELQRGRDALEATVQERTADLAIANRELSQEIEERKTAEKALRDSEGKLSAILGSIVEPMSMIDKDLNIIWTNSTATRLFGEDIVGKKCFEVFHRGEKPCEPYPCLTLKAFQDGRVHEHDTQVVDKDGQIQHFHCTANVALRDDQGNPTAVLEISEDITERVRAEEERLTLVAQMQHAQKLESLGVLAGGIAHDFNNLLTSVLGNAALALRDLPPVSPVRDKMHQIEIAAQRGADLTRQMLAYSGKGRLVVIPLDLNKLVEEMSHLLRTAIPTRTTLKHKFAGNLPAIEADAAQIQQVILNRKDLIYPCRNT
jgi:PAS domain S-box-containing protein